MDPLALFPAMVISLKSRVYQSGRSAGCFSTWQ